MNSWYLRDYALRLSRHWYWLLLSILIGAALGWAASTVWPATYQATQELYIGLNAYRASSDRYIAQVAQEQFTNLDDYKHWQMSQIEAIALSRGMLEEALAEMRMTEPAWEAVDPDELRGMVTLAWRNAGVWEFIVLHPERELAQQAAETWSFLVLEEIRQAVGHAQAVQFLDAQYLAVARQRTALQERQLGLEQIQAALQDRQQELNALPEDASLSVTQQVQIQALLANAADWSPAWQAFLQQLPSEASAPAAFSEWIQAGERLITAELELLPAQITALEQQAADLQSAYIEQADLSRGVAANVSIELWDDAVAQVELLRPRANLIVTGALLGLFVWIGIEIVALPNREQDAA